METRTRTIAKTLSWRLIATVVTGTLTWLITGSWELGVTLGAADTLTKLVLYYFHERAWLRVRVGYQPQAEGSRQSEQSSAPVLAPATPSRG